MTRQNTKNVRPYQSKWSFDTIFIGNVTGDNCWVGTPVPIETGVRWSQQLSYMPSSSRTGINDGAKLSRYKNKSVTFIQLVPYLKIFLPGNQVLGGLFGFLRKIGRNLVPQAVSFVTLRSLNSSVSDLDSLNPDPVKNLNLDPEDP